MNTLMQLSSKSRAVQPVELDGVAAKLLRADEHFQVLHDELFAWLASTPYGVRRHVNSEATRHSVYIEELRRPPDFERWSLIIADCLHNLRAALDQTAYAIALSENPPFAKGKAPSLPIADKPEDFRSAHWHIEGLSAGVCAAIQSIQPYNRRHPTLPPLLTILRTLDDADKHRLLQVTSSSLYAAALQGVTGLSHGQHFQIVAKPGPIKHGSEIFALVLDRPSPDVNYELFQGDVVAVVISEDLPDVGRAEIIALIRLIRTEVVYVIDTLIQAARISCV